MMLCQGGDRKSESVVLTLKVRRQAAFVPGNTMPPLSQSALTAGKSEEDENCAGDLKVLHQKVLALCRSCSGWRSFQMQSLASDFKILMMLVLAKNVTR